MQVLGMHESTRGLGTTLGLFVAAPVRFDVYQPQSRVSLAPIIKRWDTPTLQQWIQAAAQGKGISGGADAGMVASVADLVSAELDKRLGDQYAIERAKIQTQLDAAVKAASDCAADLKLANANLTASKQSEQAAIAAKAAAEKDAVTKIAAADAAAKAAAAARAAAETAAASQVSTAQAAAAQAEAKRQQAAKDAADAIAAAQTARSEAGQSSALAKQAIADRDAAQKAMEAAKAEAAAAIKAAKEAQEAAAAGGSSELAKQKAMVRNVAIGGVVLALFAWRLGRR